MLKRWKKEKDSKHFRNDRKLTWQEKANRTCGLRVGQQTEKGLTFLLGANRRHSSLNLRMCQPNFIAGKHSNVLHSWDYWHNVAKQALQGANSVHILCPLCCFHLVTGQVRPVFILRTACCCCCRFGLNMSYNVILRWWRYGVWNGTPPSRGNLFCLKSFEEHQLRVTICALFTNYVWPFACCSPITGDFFASYHTVFAAIALLSVLLRIWIRICPAFYAGKW